MTGPSPRCGQPMRWSEPPGWGAVLDDPVCGRKAGHPGRHRSETAMLMHRLHRGTWGRPSGSQDVAAAIREARVQAGKSQFTLAAILGVTQQCVQNWEAAKRAPAPENWVQLELTLGPLGIVREAGPRPGAVGEAADAA